MTGLFAVGEKALLLDSKKRRYMIDLADDGEFHSHNGFVSHSQIIGNPEGVFVNSTKGSEYIVIRPTLEDFVVEMPRGAQVIYPKDLGPICMLADIGPGVKVFETGIGSGALSMTMLRYGAEIVGYELREDFAKKKKTTGKTAVPKKTAARKTAAPVVTADVDVDVDSLAFVEANGGVSGVEAMIAEKQAEIEVMQAHIEVVAELSKRLTLAAA